MPITVERTCDICGAEAHYDHEIPRLEIAPHGGLQAGGHLSRLVLCGSHFKSFVEACKNWHYAAAIKEEGQ